MKGTFYTVIYYISIDGDEYKEYQRYEIRYGKWFKNYEKEITLSREDFVRNIESKCLPFTLYYQQYQNQSKEQYVLLTKSPKFLVGGIKVNNIDEVKIKVVARKIWCEYSVEELRAKLPAEEYIEMIKNEGIEIGKY